MTRKLLGNGVKRVLQEFVTLVDRANNLTYKNTRLALLWARRATGVERITPFSGNEASMSSLTG